MVKKFRKKETVEAIQFTGANCYDVLRFIGREGLLRDGLNELKQTDRPIIPTPVGNLTASTGDWIVEAELGQFRLVGPDIFERHYEPDPAPASGDGAQQLVECDCRTWAVVDMRAMFDGNGHNPACDKYKPHVGTDDLLGRLVKGLEEWAAEEDGVPDWLWQAYSEAKFRLTGTFPKEVLAPASGAAGKGGGE